MEAQHPYDRMRDYKKYADAGSTLYAIKLEVYRQAYADLLSITNLTEMGRYLNFLMGDYGWDMETAADSIGESLKEVMTIPDEDLDNEDKRRKYTLVWEYM